MNRADEIVHALRLRLRGFYTVQEQLPTEICLSLLRLTLVAERDEDIIVRSHATPVETKVAA